MNCLEIHLLHNFGPSCVNRDDTGAQKECLFGGAWRARISSQCQKRAIREWFRRHTHDGLGIRTKLLAHYLEKQLFAIDEQEQASAYIEPYLRKYYGKMSHGKLDALQFVSTAELTLAARHIRESMGRAEGVPDLSEGKSTPNHSVDATDSEVLAELQRAEKTIDIAMFGRLLVEHPERNVTGACQVAHAVSTHRTTKELDFFTALDDQQVDNKGGSAMIGFHNFSSPCFYRYALLDVDQLRNNLPENADCLHVAKDFLRAAVLAIPSGQQHSMAAHSLPSFGLLVARRHGMPCSLVNAFARAVTNTDIIDGSTIALASYWDALHRIYGLLGLIDAATFQVSADEPADTWCPYHCDSVETAIQRIVACWE